MSAAPKIVLTGVTGFVGGMLVPRLRKAGADLLLVGRDPTTLAARFSGVASCGYDDLAQRASGFDMIVHLAVANTDTDLSEAAVFAVNVDLSLRVAKAAQAAGVPRMILLSSTHALDPSASSAYARSKREAAAALAGLDGIDVRPLHLGAVHGDGFAGRLSALRRLPAPIGRAAFSALSALKPTTHVDALTDAILAAEPPEAVVDDKDANLVYAFAVRAGDIGGALAVAVLFWWLLAGLWVAVRLTSPGPGIFAQTRIGRNGAPFTCLKFRTMAEGTAQRGTHETPAAAVTRVGAFLRRTKLDELPQIWNLLLGQMSVVGPRPCLPVQETLIAHRRAHGVLGLRPGITGLAQINDVDMSDPLRLARWDARYRALRGLLPDARIALATLRGRGRGDRTA